MRLGWDGTFGWTTLVNQKIAIRIGRSVRVQYDMYRKRFIRPPKRATSAPPPDDSMHRRRIPPQCVGPPEAPHPRYETRRGKTRKHNTGRVLERTSYRPHLSPASIHPSAASPSLIATCLPSTTPTHQSPSPPSHPAPPPRRATPSHPTTFSSPAHRPDVVQAELTRHAHTHLHPYIHTYPHTYIHTYLALICVSAA